jgi:hypothetical protein
MARHALLIATTEHGDPLFSRLTAPEEDVRSFDRVLRAAEIGTFVLLVNRETQEVREQIEDFFSQRHPDDMLLLYFSGHGVVDADGALYFVTRTTKKARLETTAVPAALVTSQMNKCRSKRQVLILDCCHSGAFERTKGGAEVQTGRVFEGSGFGRAVLTATDATQFAWEGEAPARSTPASVFTRWLVDGLESGAADIDGDGRITVDELYDYVYRRVLESGSKQTPGKWTYRQQGDVVIAKNARPVARVDLLSPALLAGLKSSERWQHESAIRELGRLAAGQHPGIAIAAQKALADDLEEAQRRTLRLAEEMRRSASTQPRTADERAAPNPPASPLPPPPPRRATEPPRSSTPQLQAPAENTPPPLPPVRPSDATVPSQVIDAAIAPPGPSRKKPIILGTAIAALAIFAVVLGFIFRTNTLLIHAVAPAGQAVSDLQIKVDDQLRCTASPCTVAGLEGGKHAVDVTARGYKPYHLAITISAGDREPLRVLLQPASGRIQVGALGSGSSLFVDGKRIGPLPQELKDVSVGDHLIVVEGDARYARFEQRVTVEFGQVVSVVPKPKVVRGLATIIAGENAAGAQVELTGTNPRVLTNLPETLEADSDKRYRIVATKKGMEPFAKEISFEDGQAERTFKIDLVPTNSSAVGDKKPTPRVRMGATTVSGRLPPEVIQRIVRQNYARFRVCYEEGLARNSKLAGRVSTRFVIGRDGSVSNVSNGGSDLPDSGVVNCVVSAFYGLSFPQPEGGLVTVVYPIMFAPG